MRIWDLEPSVLCDRHLVGEHAELHAVWAILTQDKRGYRDHPETNRWVGRLAALRARHELLVAEMSTRGFEHRSPLDATLATGSAEQTELVDTLDDQRAVLAAKGCGCRVA